MFLTRKFTINPNILEYNKTQTNKFLDRLNSKKILLTEDKNINANCFIFGILTFLLGYHLGKIKII